MRAALFLILIATPAAAHADAHAEAGSVLVAVLLLATAVAYVAGARRLGARAGYMRSALFISGLAFTAAFLLSPLDAWAARYLSAHMIQHFGLMLLAAPLIVMGRPGVTLLWALPRAGRRAAGGLGQGRPGRAWRAVTSPIGAFATYFLVLWLWHAPPLYQAALGQDAVHDLQHATFLAAALIFWTAVLAPRPGEGRAAALLAIFLTALQSCVLAALVTLSETVWYPAYDTGPFGMTALGDQQLGGLIMWVPCGAVLIGAAVATLSSLLRDLDRRNGRAEAS
ncbi:cytochrome c oxidase assembly protein [Tranquillimonas alkanivorans]|uniref:Cytochrome c oxidase caa3 assembly factor (Caa3_CtaG) n=1 Tax=Tranquillimonas alkanivorans TaxID=441119 RepID=A0A1I5VLV5_9RHOB|nr:cytochrome c oxidase assembly protein [Tranquillimonas alkanivorans]SFQ08401.1 Cytochrome c oxidase caa3 assembly factor (Caa3_CtaG) [Tranquillimonas alkanivorans]